jgi:CBS domain-containing protein
MSLGELRTVVRVRDIMTSPVITAKEDESVTNVAKLMERGNVGCVVIVDELDNPLGIVTERDVIKRVVSRDKLPSEVRSKEVMTKPLVTVNPETDIKEAARLMNRRKIRRLIVMYKGKMVGIISTKDIVAITPELIELKEEQAKIAGAPATEAERGVIMAGYCDQCGQWSDALSESDGAFLCEDCLELAKEIE